MGDSKPVVRVDYAIRYTDEEGATLYLDGDEDLLVVDRKFAARFDKRSQAYGCLERLADQGRTGYRVVRITTRRSSKLAALKDAAIRYTKADAEYGRAVEAFYEKHPDMRGAAADEVVKHPEYPHHPAWHAAQWAVFQAVKEYGEAKLGKKGKEEDGC